MSTIITVGISDMKVGKSPELFVAYALGLSVGVCIYDSKAKVGGLGQIMLPNSPSMHPETDFYRYADTCIQLMIKKMERAGASRKNITAKIAGGAQLFASPEGSALRNLGERNVLAVKAVLQKMKVSILAEDIGQGYGRTVYFHTETGSMIVKSQAQGIKTY